MASKFGGREAMQNQWVMQQNMARHKSILDRSYKPRAPQPKAAPPAKPVEPTEAAVESPDTTTR